MSSYPLRVAELFAGVGGFRIGLEGYPRKPNATFEVVWSNQYEPKTKKQHANLVYTNHWNESNHSNEDIQSVLASDIESIPNFDLLVGGFPCQDYSVANRSHNKGLDGTKGRLWYCIDQIIQYKKPSYIFLENVDRLLLSPTHQRGRDFAVMLSCLNKNGYVVEWRVINAADYGFPQRRRRIYILAYRRETKLGQAILKSEPREHLYSFSVFADAFPARLDTRGHTGVIPIEPITTYNSFENENNRFLKAGVMKDGCYYTTNYKSTYTGKKRILGDILLPAGKVPEEFWIQPDRLSKWMAAKNASTKQGVSKRTGKEYSFRQGKVAFPDHLNKPSRTIITKEGGNDICRHKHIVFQAGRYRRLHPIELERLNDFPDDFTKHELVSNRLRAFLMGNALIVGVVQKISNALYKQINS